VEKTKETEIKVYIKKENCRKGGMIRIKELKWKTWRRQKKK